MFATASELLAAEDAHSTTDDDSWLLRGLERVLYRHNIEFAQVALAAVAGSVAFNLAQPTSDVDYFGVFVADPLAMCHPTRRICTAKVVDDHDPFDIQMYEIAEFCLLMAKGNPKIMEALCTPTRRVHRGPLAEQPSLLRRLQQAMVNQVTVKQYAGFIGAQRHRLERKKKEAAAAAAAYGVGEDDGDNRTTDGGAAVQDAAEKAMWKCRYHALRLSAERHRMVVEKKPPRVYFEETKTTSRDEAKSATTEKEEGIEVMMVDRAFLLQVRRGENVDAQDVEQRLDAASCIVDEKMSSLPLSMDRDVLREFVLSYRRHVFGISNRSSSSTSMNPADSSSATQTSRHPHERDRLTRVEAALRARGVGFTRVLCCVPSGSTLMSLTNNCMQRSDMIVDEVAVFVADAASAFSPFAEERVEMVVIDNNQQNTRADSATLTSSNNPRQVRAHTKPNVTRARGLVCVELQYFTENVWKNHVLLETALVLAGAAGHHNATVYGGNPDVSLTSIALAQPENDEVPSPASFCALWKTHVRGLVAMARTSLMLNHCLGLAKALLGQGGKTSKKRAKKAQAKPAQAKPAQAKPAQAKPAQTPNQSEKPAQDKSMASAPASTTASLSGRQLYLAAKLLHYAHKLCTADDDATTLASWFTIPPTASERDSSQTLVWEASACRHALHPSDAEFPSAELQRQLTLFHTEELTDLVKSVQLPRSIQDCASPHVPALLDDVAHFVWRARQHALMERGSDRSLGRVDKDNEMK